MERAKKKQGEQTYRSLNPLPLLRFRPGGVQRELIVCRSPDRKSKYFSQSGKSFFISLRIRAGKNLGFFTKILYKPLHVSG